MRLHPGWFVTALALLVLMAIVLEEPHPWRDPLGLVSLALMVGYAVARGFGAPPNLLDRTPSTQRYGGRDMAAATIFGERAVPDEPVPEQVNAGTQEVALAVHVPYLRYHSALRLEDARSLALPLGGGVGWQTARGALWLVNGPRIVLVLLPSVGLIGWAWWTGTAPWLSSATITLIAGFAIGWSWLNGRFISWQKVVVTRGGVEIRRRGRGGTVATGEIESIGFEEMDVRLPQEEGGVQEWVVWLMVAGQEKFPFLRCQTFEKARDAASLVSKMTGRHLQEPFVPHKG